MLLQPQYGSSEAAPVEFLLAFCRALIRQHPSPDCLLLAMSSAKAAVPISLEQEMKFLLGIQAEANNSVWPKGFF